jgi:hypothetical protein
MRLMKVDLPHPDSPVKATDSLGSITKFNPLRTKSSFLVGYLNHTSLNSILPIYPSKSLPSLGSFIPIASILDGQSIILKIASAAVSPLEISEADVREEVKSA